MPDKTFIFGKLLGLVCLLAGWTGYGFAATPAGVLHPIAVVQVNGAAVSQSSVIFNGDMIRTGVSAARLEASGYAVLLDKETTALIQDDQLTIICGGAVVKTLQGMSVRVGNLIVKPSGQSARFEVKRQAERMQITALDGNLNLSDGSRNLTLSKGNQLTLSCSRCVQDAVDGQLSDAQASCSLSDVASANPAGQAHGANIAFAAAAAGGPAIVIPLSTHIGRTPISPDRP